MLSILILLTCALTAYSTESFLSISEPSTSRSLESVGTTNKVTRYLNTFTIVKTIPRKRRFFTEGLSFTNANTLLESVGNYGGSKIQYINATDMSVLEQQALPSRYFGEGCAEVNNGHGDIVYQMTWKERTVFAWDAKTLKLKNTLVMPKQILEGWGMAKRPEYDNKGNIVMRLYVSDGSSNIHVVDPIGFTVLRSFKVYTSDNGPVTMLNELEFVKGKLWANIWTSNNIAVIDPATGFVEAMIDFSLLTRKAYQRAREFGLSWNGDSVLNGIAYYPTTEKLLLTGKMWPMMFQIKVPIEGL